MKFNELLHFPFVRLYAGDLPDMPEYRITGTVGLSLTQDDKWHICHDVTHRMPIDSASVDAYQSEDVFEHIEYKKIKNIINDIYRVLKKGGLFRFSLPDYRCDVIYNRTLRDQKGNILFDPFGGGDYKRSFLFFGEKKVINGGHLWFPRYENVYRLLDGNLFSSVEFLHYYDEYGVYVTKKIDYSKGFIQRTPDHDERVSSPFRPMSIVVDCIK